MTVEKEKQEGPHTNKRIISRIQHLTPREVASNLISIETTRDFNNATIVP